MIEGLLTAGIAVAALVVVFQMHQMERQVRIERALLDAYQTHQIIVSLLRVWAEHWGEDPEQVRPFLTAVLKTSISHTHARASDSSMGLDLGLTELWDHLRRGKR